MSKEHIKKDDTVKAPKENKSPEAEAEAPAKKTRDRKKTARTLRTVKAVSIVVAIVIILGGAGVGVGGYLVTNSDKNLPNVFVGDVLVGRMTPEETLAALQERDWDKTVNGTMEVKLPVDIRFGVDRIKSGIVLNAENAAAAAYRYGHDGGWFGNFLTFVGSVFSPEDVTRGDKMIDTDYLMKLIDMACVRFDSKTGDSGPDVDLENATITFFKGAGQLQIDKTALCDQIIEGLKNESSEVEYVLSDKGITAPDFQKLLDEMLAEPADAYYERETGEIVDEVVGISFDAAEAENLWNAAGPAEKVVIPVNVIEPEVTKTFLEEILFRDQLGAQTTYYWGSTSNRINNIQLVADKLNGLILMPGDVFSYNEFVGQRTEEAGFKAAGAYNNGQVVQEIGGGICQVSSTLYCAAMLSQLETVERTCHDFPVTYLDPGLDATVSWPGPDFKFRNCRDYPVKIVSYCEPSKSALTIEIWGSNLDGTYVELHYGSWGIYDETYPEVQIGYGARSYRHIFDRDGNLIDVIDERFSHYDFHPEDIQWPEPTETPEGEIEGDLPEPDPEPEPETDPIITD